MSTSQFKNIEISSLSHLQVGRIGEYWVKLMLTLHGFEVFYNDVDDRGIDFILRSSENNEIIDVPHHQNILF